MPVFLFFLLALFSLTPVVSAEQTANDLSAEPLTSPRCNVFTFDSTGSYDPDDEKITVAWDFGDGTSADQPVIDHAYSTPGDYPVKLTISDHSSSICCTSVLAQTVRVNLPPEASFSAPDKVCTETAVTFTEIAPAATDSFNNLYDWDFGDGTRSSVQGSVKKTYTKGGDFKVTLAVDDQKNSACSARSFSRNIHVNQPPIAQAGDDVMEQCLPAGQAGLASPDESITMNFNAARSSDANDDPLSYVWDFGDGAKAQGIQVSHVYKTPDHYDVKLIVDDQTDYNCSTSADFIQLRIGVAPKAKAGEAATACPDEDVVFDGSGSYAQTRGTLGAEWNFGDGQSAEGLKTKHAYQKAGRYSAVLSVKNLTNQACPESKDTKAVIVNTAPKISLTAPKASCLGQAVEFTASAQDPDGDALEYYWTFGDGSILRGGSKVSHEYSQGGRYRVSVIVDDSQKTSCSTGTAEAMVKVNTPPQAHISLPAAIQTGKSVEFDASASSDPDGDNLLYQWDFGDGTRGEGLVAAHTYQSRGSYQVKLSVNDASGTSCDNSQDSMVADVRSAPIAVMTIR